MTVMWAALLLLSVSPAVAHTSYDYAPGCATCTSAKSYPCSTTISQSLLERAHTYLTDTSDDKMDAWDKISNNTQYKKDTGFYVFAYDFTGPCVAHGANYAFVGKTLPQIVAMVNNPTNGQTVDDALQAGAAAGGGWTKYGWTNTAGQDPISKIAYTKKLTKWGNDYYLGVGYNHVQDNKSNTCVTTGASACAEKNTLIIMGNLLSSLYTANATEMNAIFTSVTDKSAFRTDSGFYPFIYEFDGPCVAHGSNSAFVGKTLPQIVDFINNPSDGQVIDDALQAGADNGGGWVEYDWKNNADEAPYKKIAYSMMFTNGGKDYYAGVGYNNVCQAGYMALKQCENAPADPVTGPGGCAPTTSMECGEIKKAYKGQGCCGNPTKMMHLPDKTAYRRLSGDRNAAVETVVAEALQDAYASGGRAKALQVSRRIQHVVEAWTVME